jgi:hypothetical protein
MIDSTLLTRLGQIRQQELLQEARATRQHRQNQANQAGLGGQLLAYVGTILITAGQQLGAESHSKVEVVA